MVQDTKEIKTNEEKQEEMPPSLCGYCGCEIKEIDGFAIVGDKKCCLPCLDRT